MQEANGRTRYEYIDLGQLIAQNDVRFGVHVYAVVVECSAPRRTKGSGMNLF